MRRRLLGLLLVMVMILTMLPSQTFAVDPEEGTPSEIISMEAPASQEAPAQRICEEGCILEGEEEHLENGGECFVWIPCTLTEGCEGPEGHADECYGVALYAGELPIHFFLASPGNITNPNGSYVNYYGPSGSARNWDGAWTVSNIKQNANWRTMYTQNGIRNVSEEAIVTQYVASYPHGLSAASFKDFGSVTINGTVYRDTEYEIKWVSIMCRDNKLNDRGMNCNQYSFKDEHIHVDGLLVKKVEPGEMEVFKAIPETAVSQTTATSFHFKLEKMLQASLTTPPTSATAVDTSFTPLTLTATIPAGKKEAQITGGSEITFGYYKLTEIPNELWNMTGITLTGSNGRSQTVAADALYICIAPNGTVQYSTSASGPYTAMNHVAVQNERIPVTVTYQWRIYDGSETYSEVLPNTLGAHSVPAPVTNVPIGSDFTYNTGFVEGTTYHDYENGLLYTFHGWDTYSHSSVFEVDPSATGYESLDDGDKDASNNKKIPITADTWINGYWSVSPLEAADAYLKVHKDVVVSSGDANYVKNYLQNTGNMFIQIDPGIDLNDDGTSQVDADYDAVIAEGGYLVNVYQYEKDFVFTEKQADIPGYTRAVSVTVSGNNLSLTSRSGDTATVHIEEEYDPAQAPYNLGTVTYTNTYTKNVGTPVTEYPVLTLVKRATDTGDLQSGAVFTLYSDVTCTAALTSVTTDADGKAVIHFENILRENSNIGTVYLKETVAPEGYLVNDAVYTLTLTKSEQEMLRGNAFVTVTSYSLAITVPTDSGAEPIQSLSDELEYLLNVANDPIRGKLTVVKESEGLAEGDKASLSASVTIHGPITRNAQGAITALGGTYMLTLHEDNRWTAVQGDLPVGEYLIHENAALIHGYTWDMENIDYGDLEQEDYNGITSAVFEVNAENRELSVTITNTYKVWEAADFEIHKITPSGAGLGGATFVLYGDEACTNAVQTHTTTANGYAYFGDLTVSAEDPDGIATYYLKETAAPAGYYLSDAVYKVEIKAVTSEGKTSFETKISTKGASGWVESSDFIASTDTLTVVNKPITGRITITKQMMGAPEDLTSVSFYVTGPGGYAETVTLTAEESWSVTLADLALGEYTIIESEADIPGYSLITAYSVNGGEETTDKAVVVLKEADEGNTTARTVIAGQVDITNTYSRNDVYYDVPTTLTIQKVGEAGEALPGAVFRLDRLDKAGKNVINTASLTTGTNGIVTFELLIGHSDEESGIAPGKYILSEVKAPDGYVKTEATWTVTVVDDDGEVRVKLNKSQNVFENFWDWVVGDVEESTYEDGILTISNAKKTGELVIEKAVIDEEGYYADAEYTFKLDCSNNAFDKTFTLRAGESYTVQDIPWGTTYTLTEQTEGAAFVSSIDDAGEGLIWADSTAITVTNTYVYDIHNEPLSLVKVDADDNKVIPGAGFTLYADETLEEALSEEVFSDENGHLFFPIEAAGTYYLAETTTPDGYHPYANVYVVTAEEKVVVKNSGTSDAFTQFQMHIRVEGLAGTTGNDIDYTYLVENTAIKQVIVTATKQWDDSGYHARPESVDVVLYRDNEPFETVALNASNNWTYTWNELTDEYDWSVDEVTVPAQYSKTIENNGNDWIITNIRTPNPVEISVTKAWQHNGGKNLPEAIEVTLYKDGEEYDTVILNNDNDWAHTWTDLTDVSVWSVNEVNVPAGYTRQLITEDGLKFTIVNTRIINPVEVHVAKVWIASEGVIHPESVEAVLYRDGEVYDTVTLNTANDWGYTWTGLTDEYTWRVDEKAVPAGYTKNVTSDGYDFTITNTKEFEKIDVSVTKIWYGTDVVHPTSVKVTLYRDGIAYDTVTLSASDSWSYTWEDLTDEYEWTVDEPSVPSGYNKTVRRNGYSFTIMNTHENNPDTGDYTNLLGMGTMAVVSTVGFGATALMLIPRRKKEDGEE